MNTLALEHAQAIHWQQAVQPPGENTLHVWCWDADTARMTPALLSTLDERESQRHDRLVTPELKQRYAASHVGMRQVLSSYLSVEAGDLQYQVAKQGKPTLVDHCLAFNLSHSGNLVLLAVSRTDVGIDCEQHRDVKSRDALVAKHFSGAEHSHYTSLAGHDATRYFFQTWARKEAIVKFTGLGLAASVRQFSTHQAACISLPTDWPTDYRSAVLMDIATSIPMAAAVAMEQEPTRVDLFRLDWLST